MVGGRVSCPEFVGRAEELASLEAALGQASEGRATTVLVGGDAGIGKTRLVEELCSRARGRGIQVAAGVCAPVDGRGLPFGPVVGVLRDLVDQLGPVVAADVVGPACQGLGVVLPGQGDPDQGAAEPLLQGALAKTKLFESILRSFTRVAERSATVLVFEDLHWADSATLELVDFLTRNLGGSSVLLVGTYRIDELDREHPLRPVLAELRRSNHALHVQLRGFDRGEVATLMTGILGHQPERHWLEAVHARCDGNAFFAEELVAAGANGALSAQLKDIVMARVERLSADARRMLGLVATVGVAVEHRLLVAASELDLDRLDHATAETVERQLLVVDPDRTGYRFRHALVREAVYDALLPGERARLHGQVAAALASDQSLSAASGQVAAELAAHWWAAGEWNASLHASIAAAAEAERVFAFTEALAQLERALSAWDRASDEGRSTADHVDLLERSADAAFMAGTEEQAVGLAQAVIDAIDADTDPERAALGYARLGRSVTGVGDIQASFQAFRRAAALLPTQPPSAELALVLAEEARALMLMARYREAEDRSRDAINVARAAGARSVEGHATNTLGICRASLGHTDEGLALVRAALEIAEEAGTADDLNRAYLSLSHLLMVTGRLDAAAAVTLDGVAVGEQVVGIRLYGAALNSTEALICLGRWAEADELLATLEGVAGNCKNQSHLLHVVLGTRRGDLDEAARWLGIADEATSERSDVQGRGWFHILQAELALEEGRARDAKDAIDRALALTAGTDDELYGPQMCAIGVRALADLDEQRRARGSRRDDDADKARLLAAGLAQEADRLVSAPEERGGECAPRARAFALLCRAEESRLHGAPSAPWDDAATCWAELAEPYEMAYCRWREAEALLRLPGGRAKANESLQLAWRTCDELGAVPLRTKIEGLAQRARIPLATTLEPEDPRSSVASDLALTAREVEVLGRVAAGRTDRQIAEELFISKKTVSVHVSNLLRKLDVANRFEAAEIAQRVGLR